MDKQGEGKHPATEKEEPLVVLDYMAPLVPAVDKFLLGHVLGKHGPARLLRKWKRKRRMSVCDGT